MYKQRSVDVKARSRNVCHNTLPGDVIGVLLKDRIGKRTERIVQID